MDYLQIFEIFMLAISFYFLFIYGIKLSTMHNNNRFFLLIPNILMVFLLFFAIVMYSIGGYELLYPTTNIFVKYLIGFPSILLTAFALKKKSEDTRIFFNVATKKYLNIIFVTFIIYAFASLLVNKTTFFPANIINKENFMQIFGFPVQLIRLLCGIVSTFSILMILDALDKDFMKKVEIVEKETAIYEERERIGQDIHDGTLQSLFSIGLRLQHISDSLESEDTGFVKEHLQHSLDKIDLASQEIRSYIVGLNTKKDNIEFIGEIKGLIKDFTQETDIPVHFDYKKTQTDDLDSEISCQLTFIIREALNNIRKHAQASLVQIVIVVYRGKLELIIKDNGKGFDYKEIQRREEKGLCFGLNNIKHRVQSLDGFANIKSSKGKGTEISLVIPID